MAVADISIVARGRTDRLGEGPLWCPGEEAVYWVDIPGRRVNRLRLTSGDTQSWVMPEMVGWLIERADRTGFVAGFATGFKSLILDPFTVEDLAGLPGHPPDHRMNDGKADATGAIWAGTVAITCDRPTGALYRLGPDGQVNRADDGYIVANGPAISPDGRWLFHTDSGRNLIYRFALDGATLGPRETFVAFEPDWGSPDGMTFDADGGLWVAHWGGGRVSRFDPQGKVERAISLPASQITSMAFAGAALDRMFVTSAADGVRETHAGALFEVDPGCRGLVPHRFGVPDVEQASG